jgi:hypothetical protein
MTVAAAQFHQTGHSGIAQHFSGVKVGRRDIADLGASCSKGFVWMTPP